MQDSSSPHTDVFPAFEPPIREICLAHSPQVELRPETLYVTAPWPHQHQEAFSLRCAQAGARALTSYTPEQDALALANKLAQQYRAMYEQMTDVAMHFFDITLKAPDLNAMVCYFREIMHNPVIVYDEFFNPVISPDPRLEGYDRDSATLERCDLMNLFFYKQRVVFWDKTAPQPACTRLLFPVLYHDAAKGYLAIFDVETPWEKMDPTLLALFGNFALSEMCRTLELKDVEERYISDFLYDLIFRKDARLGELHRRAKALKLAMDAPYCVIALLPTGQVSNRSPDVNGYMPEDPDWADRVMNHVRNFVGIRWGRDIVTRFSQTTVILHRLSPDELHNTAALKTAAQWLCDRLKGPFAGMEFQVGIGSAVDRLDQAEDSYHRAVDALSYGSLYYGVDGGFIMPWQDSGLLKLFGKLKEADAVFDIIPPALIALEAYDQKHQTQLITTLSTYLNCNCNARRASQQLFIHYKTMHYRLKKIQEEFGLDMEQGLARVQIELGLHMLDIINAQKEQELL